MEARHLIRTARPHSEKREAVRAIQLNGLKPALRQRLERRARDCARDVRFSNVALALLGMLKVFTMCPT
jgi:hypothetical protein